VVLLLLTSVEGAAMSRKTIKAVRAVARLVAKVAAPVALAGAEDRRSVASRLISLLSVVGRAAAAGAQAQLE
jgi:hypothetical protein